MNSNPVEIPNAQTEKNGHLRQETGTADSLPLDGIKSRETAENSPAEPYTAGNMFINETVFITGSIQDADAIARTGAAAIAADTAGPFDLINLLTEWNTAELEQGTAVICLDNTDAGRQRSAELLREVQGLHIKCMACNICNTHRTPAEASEKDYTQFAQDIQAAQEKAKAARLPDALDAFLDQIQTEAYKPNTTGISFLDDLLTGGIIKQTLTLLMAAPGAGKTTLCQQTAEAIAATGKPVIFLNLEMSKEQMLAKAISSRLAQKGKNINTLKVLQGYNWTDEERDLITAEVNDYRQNVYKYLQYNPDGISSDLDKIRDYLTDTGEKTRAAGTPAPAVILDYLHLVSTTKGLDTAELIKQTVTMLKDYAIKYDTFVIAIIAVSREAMKKGQLTMTSGRDSSNLEFTADYIITLNYYDIDQGTASADSDSDLAKLQAEQYRRMILRLPKARYGRPGKTAKVYFNAAGNYFLSGDFIPDGAKPFDDPFTTQPKTRY